MALVHSFTIIILLQALFMYNVRADDENVLRFMALGDWGGLPWGEFNYSTAVERGVADGMARLANEKPQDFIIALGKVLAYADFEVYQYYLSNVD